MDGVLITAIVIMIIIALIEGTALLAESIMKNRRENYYAILPVFHGDEHLKEKLMDISESTNADIILLNCGADSEESAMCWNFCYFNPNAVFINIKELENYFSESFAINNKK